MRKSDGGFFFKNDKWGKDLKNGIVSTKNPEKKQKRVTLHLFKMCLTLLKEKQQHDNTFLFLYFSDQILIAASVADEQNVISATSLLVRWNFLLYF